MGADDYVTKPFHKRELLARVKAVLRRKRRTAGTYSNLNVLKEIRFNGWTLDLMGQCMVSKDNESISLTAHEFQVLSLLAKSPGRVFSRDQILDLIADRNWTPYDRSVDVLISRIRRKLKDNPNFPSIIKTVRSSGYIFVGHVEEPPI